MYRYQRNNQFIAQVANGLESLGRREIEQLGGTGVRAGYRSITFHADHACLYRITLAIITYTGWDGQTPLFDPMCGSGTLLCEALIFAADIPAAYLRSHFGLEHMPDFDPLLWTEIREEGTSHIQNVAQGLIRGSDRDQQAINAAQTKGCLAKYKIR